MEGVGFAVGTEPLSQPGGSFPSVTLYSSTDSFHIPKDNEVIPSKATLLEVFGWCWYFAASWMRFWFCGKKNALKDREENDLVWLFGCNCSTLDLISLLWKSLSVSNQAS